MNSIFVKCIIGLIAVLACFWGGVKYEQIKRHKQEILMFANIMGNEIISSNQLIDSFDSKPKLQIVAEYNKSILVDIGCSAWLEYIDDFSSKDLMDFSRGVNLAIEKANVESQDECIKKLIAKLKAIH